MNSKETAIEWTVGKLEMPSLDEPVPASADSLGKESRKLLALLQFASAGITFRSAEVFG